MQKPRRPCFCVTLPWRLTFFDPKVNVFSGLMMEHFCQVWWSLAARSRFCDIVRKNRQTDRHGVAVSSWLGSSSSSGGADVDGLARRRALGGRPGAVRHWSRPGRTRLAARQNVAIVSNRQTRRRQKARTTRSAVTTAVHRLIANRSQHSQECTDPRRRCWQWLETLTLTFWPQNKWVSMTYRGTFLCHV